MNKAKQDKHMLSLHILIQHHMAETPMHTTYHLYRTVNDVRAFKMPPINIYDDSQTVQNGWCKMNMTYGMKYSVCKYLDDLKEI